MKPCRYSNSVRDVSVLFFKTGFRIGASTHLFAKTTFPSRAFQWERRSRSKRPRRFSLRQLRLAILRRIGDPILPGCSRVQGDGVQRCQSINSFLRTGPRTSHEPVACLRKTTSRASDVARARGRRTSDELCTRGALPPCRVSESAPAWRGVADAVLHLAGTTQTHPTPTTPV